MGEGDTLHFDAMDVSGWSVEKYFVNSFVTIFSRQKSELR